MPLQVALVGLVAWGLRLWPATAGAMARLADRESGEVPAAAWLDPAYLDRSRIARQSVGSPGVVTTILAPALGAPARIEPGRAFPVILAGPADQAWTFRLVPRAALEAIDEVLYELPPDFAAPGALAARLARAKLARTGAASSAGTRPPAGGPEGDTVLAARCQAVASEAIRDVRRRVLAVSDRVRSATAAHHAAWPRLEREGDPENLRRGPGGPVKQALRPPLDLAPGLYTIAVLNGRGDLVDFQVNAAYVPAPRAPGEPVEFVLAADLQWGDTPAVSGSVLKFVAFLNGLAAAGRPAAPEFALVAGDIVDCAFGSAGTVAQQLYGGAADYPRDFLQAWLALAALRVPVYLAPGNHDGYRFESALGFTHSDGLLLYESTFGPLYYSFDVLPFRFIVLNGYDLPAEFRTLRRSSSSSVVESFSEKLNVMNWGGAVRWPQYRWLRERLGLAPDDGPRLAELPPASAAAPPAAQTPIPIVVVHQDPRGAYASLRPTPVSPETSWSAARHFPVTAGSRERETVFRSPTPGFGDTLEVHPGHYTPLRRPSSRIRVSEWFELSLGSPSMPRDRGFPGWNRFQQEWHSNLVYPSGLDDTAPFEVAEEVVPPTRILASLAHGRVRYLLRGHDNRFLRVDLRTGESIFGAAGARALERWSRPDAGGLLGALTLEA
ncbi:MAG TPA: metallophosphoesterase, partial [Vicinamibacteria bacterium]|nr:metallophosphoesterase [Vicinamibacteria bacterium]